MSTNIGQTKGIRHSEVLITLAMLYLLIDTMCNVLGYRLVQIGCFIQNGGIFFYPITFLIADIIAEVYGFRIARLIVILDLILNIVLALCVTWVLHLPSPDSLQQQKAFEAVLGHLLWLNVSAALGLIVGSMINIFIIHRLKIVFRGKHFWVRSILSSMIGQSVMIVITAYMLFHNTLEHDKIWIIIGSDYSFRVLYAFIGVIPASLIVAVIQHYEKAPRSFSTDIIGFPGLHCVQDKK